VIGVTNHQFQVKLAATLNFEKYFGKVQFYHKSNTIKLYSHSVEANFFDGINKVLKKKGIFFKKTTLM